MASYINGRTYPFDVSFDFPHNPRSPMVHVEMSTSNGGDQKPVSGKMDTGAQTTILDFNTARTLGIENPKRGYMATGICYTATGQPIQCYQHRVFIYVRNSHGLSLQTVLYPGFAEEISCNFFGMDWTNDYCLAFGCHSVHLLHS